MEYLFLSSPALNAFALAIIRIGIGILFIGHGYLKLIRGISEWRWTGEQMKNIGVTFAPVFWGICAMLAEGVGGMCLTIGFATRIATLFMAFTMFVAVMYHIKNGDSYGYISFPLSQLIIFIGLFIAGSGILSVDHYIVMRSFC